ncbi:ABC transporter ATP-binding protein [Brevibacillus fluminis]|uniref:ABC transporter ATP-binding protein n=1 Tax=Brevibacillus fluminis TaxID=511487 RepID=UPI003F893554
MDNQPSRTDMISVSGVSKRYCGHTALAPVTLEFAQGQIVALCGGNGAGKSTLIKMIAGMIPPSTGEVTIDGIGWRRNRTAYAKKIGYMPDDFQFPGGVTVREWLGFYAALRHVHPEWIDEMLGKVGLQEHAHKLCTSLSKGMRQRLMLAQAAVAKPAVLLLDEPTNGLDLHWISWFVAMMKEFRQSGQTIVFSTHQLEVATELADELIYIHDGKLLKTFICNQADRQHMQEEIQDLLFAAAMPGA